jgi:hypothetical protein
LNLEPLVGSVKGAAFVTAHGIEIAPCAHPDRAGYFGGIFQFLEKRTLMTRQRDIRWRDKRGPACRGARSVSSSIGSKAG